MWGFRAQTGKTTSSQDFLSLLLLRGPFQSACQDAPSLASLSLFSLHQFHLKLPAVSNLLPLQLTPIQKPPPPSPCPSLMHFRFQEFRRAEKLNKYIHNWLDSVMNLRDYKTLCVTVRRKNCTESCVFRHRNRQPQATADHLECDELLAQREE